MDNRTIVITGASGGVGTAAINFFLNCGWNVVGLSRNIDKLSSIVNKRLLCIKTDIRDYKSVYAAFSSIKSSFSNIDVLINNASVFKQKQFINFTNKDIDNIIDTNIKGTMYCSSECMKLMKGGRIINISSVSGTHGIANQAVYSASKFAMNGFAEALGQENTGITISTICPGGIDTQIWNEQNPYPGNTDNLLKPDDIVNMINYIVNLPPNIVLKNITLFPNCEWH